MNYTPTELQANRLIELHRQHARAVHGAELWGPGGRQRNEYLNRPYPEHLTHQEKEQEADRIQAGSLSNAAHFAEAYERARAEASPGAIEILNEAIRTRRGDAAAQRERTAAYLDNRTRGLSVPEAARV